MEQSFQYSASWKAHRWPLARQPRSPLRVAPRWKPLAALPRRQPFACSLLPRQVHTRQCTTAAR